MKGSRPHVFLTGATGQVGGVALAELLEAGTAVTCLGRSKAQKSAEERIRATLAVLGRDARARFDVVEGDLTRPGLGLPDDVRAGLAEKTDRIVHCAARVEFENTSDGEPVRTNLGGTIMMLDLARRAGMVPFTHVSTAYVCGDRQGLVPERVDGDKPAFRNPYEASKWAAEQEVWAAHAEGLPVAIARPSIIVGEASDGRAVHFQGFYLVCRAVSWMCSMAQHDRLGGEALTIEELDLPGDLDGPINLVPADYVGAAVARIGMMDAALGGVYHLTHPEPPTLDALVATLAGFYSLSLPKLDARRGRPLPGIRPSLRPQPGSLRRGLSRATKGFWKLSAVLRPYFAAYPRFEVSRSQALLAPLGVSPAPVDDVLLWKVLDYAERVGFGRVKA